MIVNYFVKDIKVEEIWPLEEVKNYLRISHEYDDILIQSLIESATESAENFTGLSINHRHIECKIQSAKSDFTLKYLPILSIDEVYILERDKKKKITDTFGYVNNTINRIYFNDDYVDQDIEIKYIAGHKKIPRTITHAILMHVVLMYEHSENGTNLNSQILDLYLPHRIIKI
jgi:uncharacterized phiE125 gp8 family phage protein